MLLMAGVCSYYVIKHVISYVLPAMLHALAIHSQLKIFNQLYITNKVECSILKVGITYVANYSRDGHYQKFMS